MSDEASSAGAEGQGADPSSAAAGGADAGAGAAAPAAAAATPPAKSDADYEKRMEEVLAVDRSAKENQRQADIKLKQAEDLVKSVGHLKGAHEKLTKGQLEDLVDVAQEMYGDKLNEDLLMALAQRLTQGKPPVDPETLFEKKWAEKQKEAHDKAAAEVEAERVAREAAEDKEVSDYLTRSAAFLTSSKDDPRFELCHSLGVDTAHYQELLFAHIREHKEVPEPEVLLAKIEAEHDAKLANTSRRRQAAGQDEGVRFSAPIVPRGHVPDPPPLDEDPWRARLMAQDQELRTKQALGRSG